jgi:RIO kinase 1
MRQHVLASTRTQGSASSPAFSGALPAMNRRRRQPEASTASDSNTSTKAPIHSSKVDSTLAQLQQRFASHMALDSLNSVNTATRKGGSERVLNKDKSDRATNEQVLDPRTRLVLFKMIGRGLISRIDGCVSTGKEVGFFVSH